MGLISKIQSSPSGKISTRFSHIDLNLIMSKAASLKGMATAIVLTALFESWISDYGTPTKITTEKGSQFESLVMQSVCQLYEYPENQHTCLSSAVKRLMESFHFTLKVVPMCSAKVWTRLLSTVMLGLKTSFKEDLQVYFCTNLKITGEFFHCVKVQLEPLIWEGKHRKCIHGLLQISPYNFVKYLRATV